MVAANSINESTTGICGFTGTAFTSTAATNHAVLIGGSTSSTLTNVGPTSTAGQVLQSAGSSADPVFSTATFPATATGTGKILRADGTNWVATTATFPDTAGTSGNVLTSNGTNWASTAPASANAFQTVTAQRFTSTGAFTYTPTSGMKYVVVELCGGGGGSGGTAATTANVAASQAGGGGSYAKFILTAAQVGASLTGSVGIAGTAGGSNGAGGAGGNTTLATSSAWTAAGGSGGNAGAAATTITTPGAAGGTVTTGTGTILVTSSGSTASEAVGIGSFVLGGYGGSSLLGIGGQQLADLTPNAALVGATGVGFGAGASSTISFGTVVAQVGQAGTTGIAIFTEFLNV